MNAVGINGIQPGHPGAAMQVKQMNGAMNRAMEPVDRMSENKKQLNTAIYDYFLKMKMYDLCRALIKSETPLELDDPSSKSGKQEDDSYDAGRPSDVPLASQKWRSMSVDTAHLLDWFSIFWDMWKAQQHKNGPDPSLIGQYHTHLANQNRLEHQRQHMIMQRGIGPIGPQQIAMMRGRGLAGGMAPNAQQQQQLMMKQRQMMAQQANMAREGSGMDGDGQRPRTPMSGDNAPSPNKRQRLEGNPQFAPGQMMQNGQDMRNMLHANGIHHPLTPNQIANLQNASQQVRHKSVELFTKHMQPGAHTQQRANMGSPIVPQGAAEQQMIAASEFYNPRMQGNGHALQDYQMQLMLLERQNRMRLEMAKQEQHNMPADGQAANGGSPMPDGGMQRPSPSAMNYNGQMPPGMEKNMQMNPNAMRGPHPNFPNGTPMNPGMMPNGQQGGPNQPQMNGGNFQGGQQGPMGPGGQVPAPMGTPRNPNMGPPPGMPPANQNPTGRAPSPAPSAATNTPSVSHKAAPKKGKGETKKGTKPKTGKAAAAAAAAAAAPAENADTAPTASTPATPITPALTNPANKAAVNANQINSVNAASGPGQQNGGPVAGGPGQQVDPNAGVGQNQDSIAFSGIDDMDMTFSSMEAGDVLENFNFDSYIEDPPQEFSITGLDFGAFDSAGMDNEGVGV